MGVPVHDITVRSSLLVTERRSERVGADCWVVIVPSFVRVAALVP
jgi:hypothetical protein